MAVIKWNNDGERYFEAGVDRGVLYTQAGDGVAWNGLVAVSEKPNGGEPQGYYQDGVRFLNVAGIEEFAGTIEAFTYPLEFEICDGTADFEGLYAYQQPRKPFGLAYRTRVGNDIDAELHAYKIHIVYNALAAPSQKDYESLSEDQQPVIFSWEFVTTPVQVETNRGVLTISHLAVDTRKASAAQVRLVENYLYGSPTLSARLPTPKQIFSVFESQAAAFTIVEDTETGISDMVEASDNQGDLLGAVTVGIYVAPNESRLTPTATPGIFTLEG